MQSAYVAGRHAGADAGRVAGRLRRRQADRRSVAVNLTPMIDVVFNLLVFFVACGAFAMPEGWLKARLPRAGGPVVDAVDAVDPPPPITPLRIRLEAGARPSDCLIWVDRDPQPLRDFIQLRARLVAERERFGPRLPVTLAAAKGVSWQHTVDAFNQAVAADFEDIWFEP